MQASLDIRSDSNDNIYTLTLSQHENELIFSCNCGAGISNMICKHRLNIIEGNYKNIERIDQLEVFQGIFDSTYKQKIKVLFGELQEIEKQIKDLDLKKKKMKKDIGLKLSKGF